MKYDVIDNNNGTLTLDIAVPGLRKEDLSLTFNDGLLHLKSITKPPEGFKYICKQIPDTYEIVWEIPSKYQVETADCGLGILRILLVPNKTKDTVIRIK